MLHIFHTSFISVHNLHIFWYVCSKYNYIIIFAAIVDIWHHDLSTYVANCALWIKNWLEQVEIALARSKSYSSSHSWCQLEWHIAETKFMASENLLEDAVAKAAQAAAVLVGWQSSQQCHMQVPCSPPLYKCASSFKHSWEAVCWQQWQSDRC